MDQYHRRFDADGARRHFGFSAAEKIVVCFCVLCFFWGAFAFIAASTRRAPWMLSPAIAMITYGFTFYAGFMNFYLSLGFGFFAAALSWRGTRRDWILASVLGLCVLSVVRPRRWIFAGLTILAAVFFAFEYSDTGILDGMERQVEMLVAALPYGARVSYTIDFGNVTRINSRHLVDRACIGRCFTYSNYEPGTGQFRLRILPQGSRVVSQSGLALEHGTYIVRAEDVPLWEIYQPDEDDLTKLAIRSLTVGEKNGRLGHQHPL